MNYPFNRGRILRSSPSIRSLVEETQLSANDFITPLFVTEGNNIKEEIPSMPGYYRYSMDFLAEELDTLSKMELKSVLLFIKVSDEKKDNTGKEALNPDGLFPKTIEFIKSSYPELCIMTDIALDPFSSFGHDGIVEDGKILNDETVEILSEMAVVHANAGADFVAPSDMMDGRIGAIREKLEEKGMHETGIMAYSAKYASCFYGPFRDALDSAPGFGDKKTYQMNPANKREALKEVFLDIDEGADIVMVKPALSYLDIIHSIKEKAIVPVSAYHVSGEYSMIKAAAENGWIDEKAAVVETLTSIKRAGADLIATYFSKDIIRYISE